jgi:DNA recombination-dependent growth factor C
MALRSGSATFARFRTAPLRARGADLKRLVVKALRAHAFEPLDPSRSDEDRAAGFVELEDAEATRFDADVLHGDLGLFAWRVDTLKVPGAELKAQVARWGAAFAQEHGRPPGRREKAQARDGLKQELRRRAAPSTRVHEVSWNLTTGELQIWSGSRKVVEEVAAAIATAFSVKPQPLTPGARAAVEGVPDARLLPTAALVGLSAGQGVDHGEA